MSQTLAKKWKSDGECTLEDGRVGYIPESPVLNPDAYHNQPVIPTLRLKNRLGKLKREASTAGHDGLKNAYARAMAALLALHVDGTVVIPLGQWDTIAVESGIREAPQMWAKHLGLRPRVVR